MGEMTELKTEIKMPHLTIDERPMWSPFVRVQGEWRLDALGRYWSPGELAALAVLALGVGAVALWRLVGGTK